MARIDTLVAKQRALHAEHGTVLEAMDAATDPEQKKSLRDKASAIKAQFDEATADVKVERDRLDAEKALGGTLPVAAGARAAQEQETHALGITLGANRQLADPKKGFESPRDYIAAVVRAGQGRGVDDRLKPLQRYGAQGSDEQMGAQDPYGGFLLPAAFSPDLLTLRPEGDFTAGRTRQVTLEAPTVSFNARVDKNHQSSVSGGLTVTRLPETVDGSGTRMKFEQIKMVANSLYGFCFATAELMRFSPGSFISLITTGFGDEFRNKRIAEILGGTGVGEFQGVLKSPALVTVSKEGSQSAATINYQNVVKMRARCYGYSQAIWVANHDTYPQLANMSFGTTEIPIYVNSAREDRPDLLLGRPIFYSEYAETLGTLGDIGLYNFGEYLDGLLVPLESAESMHVRFMANENVVRFWKMDDGRGWWLTALTPRKGASTLSPFVVLETRS